MWKEHVKTRQSETWASDNTKIIPPSPLPPRPIGLTSVIWLTRKEHVNIHWIPCVHVHVVVGYVAEEAHIASPVAAVFQVGGAGEDLLLVLVPEMVPQHLLQKNREWWNARDLKLSRFSILFCKFYLLIWRVYDYCCKKNFLMLACNVNFLGKNMIKYVNIRHIWEKRT